MSFKYFDFICNKCSQIWEELIRDDAPKKMPKCVLCKTNKYVQRHLSTGGFRIYGEGSGTTASKMGKRK